VVNPRVLCIDDNEWIGNSIGRLVRSQPGWEWLGWRNSAAGLTELVQELNPSILVLDVDIPGEDSFEVVSRLQREHPEARVLILSGHLSSSLVDRALDSGAWGYVCKGDGTAPLLRAIETVAAGEVALSPAILEEFGRTM
jgi:two-component system, NarL family, response regulator DegU